MWIASSLAMLPLAPGAYGHPPRPPSDASKRVTPPCTARQDVRPVPCHGCYGNGRVNCSAGEGGVEGPGESRPPSG